MKDRIVKGICFLIFITSVMLGSGTTAQAQGQAPDQQQAPGKEERSKPKEFRKVFCAERSVAQRNMMVGAVDCNDLCDNIYRDYPCELQQRLDEKWKITSVVVTSIEVQKDPCECRVTGTESVLER
jgi:hypothetical protein